MVIVPTRPQMEHSLKNNNLNSIWMAVSCSFDLTVRQKKQFGDILRGRSNIFGQNYLVKPNYFLSQRSDHEDLHVYVKLCTSGLILPFHITAGFIKYGGKGKECSLCVAKHFFHRLIKQRENIFRHFRRRP